MKNVLVITSTYDLTVDYLILKNRENVKYYRLNTNTIEHYKISILLNGFKISCDEWSVSSNDITSIYYRKPMLPNLSEYDQSYHPFMAKELISFIKGIANTF